MPRSILVVDANPGFAGMLEQAFTGAGFSCTPAMTAEEAVRIASSKSIDLAIVDFHIPDASPQDLVRALRALQPGAILLGIPQDNNPENSILDEMGMQGGLYKPFYLPSLVPYVARILGEPEISAVESAEELASAPTGEITRSQSHRSTRISPWLDDVGYLVKKLEQTAAENPVVACMVTRGAELRAYIGSLTKEQLSLVARKVAESWADNPGGSLARYIHVPLMETQVYLYSTSLTVDLDLSLLFDSKTPLSITRRRALNFLKALEHDPGRSPVKDGLSVVLARDSADAHSSRPSVGENSMRREGSVQQKIDELFAQRSNTADEFPPSQRQPAVWLPANQYLQNQAAASREPFVEASPAGEEDVFHVNAENGTLGAYAWAEEGHESGEKEHHGMWDPKKEEEARGEIGGRASRLASSPSMADAAGMAQGDAPSSEGSRNAHDRGALADVMERRLRKNAFRFANVPPPNPVRREEAVEVDQRKTESAAIPAESASRARFEELPVDIGLSDRASVPAGFESPTPALVKLAYAIVLAPTFPGARLSPEMAADLEAFLRNLAISYGWKAMRTLVQSGFLAVNIVAPPHVAPAFIIRVLRRHTSQRLLSRFPALAEANPAQDFWAPGYLLIGTDQPPTPQQVADYISYTRRAQGFGAAWPQAT